MTYTILFSPEANDDLTEILGWYSTQTTKEVKKRLIEDLSKTIKSLEKSPKSFSVRFKNSRCAILKKYPYNIYYWVDDIALTANIFAILHQKRDSTVWKDRI